MILFTILLTTLLLIALVVIVTIVGGATLLLTFGDVNVCVLIIYFIAKFFTRKKKWGPSRSLSFCAFSAPSIMKEVWCMRQQRESKQHLETKIRMMEDEMLRTRNVYEIEKYQKELTFMRRKLQKMQYESWNMDSSVFKDSFDRKTWYFVKKGMSDGTFNRTDISNDRSWYSDNL